MGLEFQNLKPVIWVNPQLSLEPVNHVNQGLGPSVHMVNVQRLLKGLTRLWVNPEGLDLDLPRTGVRLA